jgi:hypothetical protein
MGVSGAGYFHESGADASAYLQQRAHLSRYNCCVLPVDISLVLCLMLCMIGWHVEVRCLSFSCHNEFCVRVVCFEAILIVFILTCS